MKSRLMMLGFVVVAGLVLVGIGRAQIGGQQASPGPGASGEFGAAAPAIAPSRLDRAGLLTNVIVTRGSTDVGGVQGENGTELRVQAVEAIAGSEKLYGIGFVLRPPQNQREMPVVETFVEEEKIDELLNVLQTLAKPQQPASKMSSTESRYRTAAGLELANFDNAGARMGAVRITQVIWTTGQVTEAGTTFLPARLEEVRRLVSSAKERIGAAKGSG